MIHTLSNSEIASLSSQYITDELKNERWSIDFLEIADTSNLLARINIYSDYTSKNDNNKFHISTFILNEFVSQLVVIFSRYLAHDTSKKKEVWILDTQSKFVRPFYTKENIEARLELVQKKIYKNNIFIFLQVTVTDNNNGLSKFKFKAKI